MNSLTARPEEETAIKCFALASPELLAARALQKRVDAKYIAPRWVIGELLSRLESHFHVVTSNGRRWANYETVYFDTSDFAFFHQHRRGIRPRHKARIRHYVERDVCYLETKTKDRYSVTTKHRFVRPARDFELHAQDIRPLRDSIGSMPHLRPSALIDFPRITLVGLEHPERLTIDLGVNFRHGDASAGFTAAIVELKQARFNSRSPGAVGLRSLGIRSQGVSKYCVALSVLGRVDRTHVFRPAIRELERRSDA